MTTPGTFNLDLYRGDTGAWRFQIWRDDTKTDPVDLTGSTAAAEIRDKPAGAKKVALDVTITEPNIIDVAITPEIWTQNPPAGKWDLEVVGPLGDVTTIVAGTVKITGDITNSTP